MFKRRPTPAEITALFRDGAVSSQHSRSGSFETPPQEVLPAIPGAVPGTVGRQKRWFLHKGLKYSGIAAVVIGGIIVAGNEASERGYTNSAPVEAGPLSVLPPTKGSPPQSPSESLEPRPNQQRIEPVVLHVGESALVKVCGEITGGLTLKEEHRDRIIVTPNSEPAQYGIAHVTGSADTVEIALSQHPEAAWSVPGKEKPQISAVVPPEVLNMCYDAQVVAQPVALGSNGNKILGLFMSNGQPIDGAA